MPSEGRVSATSQSLRENKFLPMEDSKPGPQSNLFRLGLSRQQEWVGTPAMLTR